MIALEDAMEIAEMFAPDASSLEELEDAYIFHGTGELTVYILKKNGCIVAEWQYKRMQKEK